MESTDQTLDTKQKKPPEEQQAEGDAVTTKENMGQLVWDRHYEHIFAKLSGSLIAVANKSSSCGLISRTTKRRVTDKTVYSQTERASMMIDFIIDNMERKCGNAAEIMETFISKGLDERSLEDAQKYLCEQLEEEKKKDCTTPESKVLESCQANLTTRIEGGLSSIAMRLRGNALDIGQYDMICNPEAKHTEICMHHLLKEIGDCIKHDSKKLEIFIDEVIGDMGAYFDDIVTALRAELSQPPPVPKQKQPVSDPGSSQDVEMLSDSDEQIDFEQAL